MVTISLWWAVFIVCIAALAGAGLMGISLSILVAARAHECPAAETYYEPKLLEQGYEPETVAPAADEELAQLHTRARAREWRYESAAERAARRPSEPPLEDAVMFDQTLTELLQRSQMPALPSVPSTGFDPFPTGAYSIVDRDLDDLPAPDPEPIVEGPVLPAREPFTGNKRKGGNKKRQLAGAR